MKPNADLLNQVRRVLSEATRPMDWKDIQARMQTQLGANTMVQLTNHLVWMREVEIVDENLAGRRRYRSAKAQETQQAQETEDPSQSAEPAAVNPSRPTTQKNALRRRVTGALRQAGEPLTAQELADMLDEPQARVGTALYRLRERGEVVGEKTEAGRGNKNARKWSLPKRDALVATIRTQPMRFHAVPDATFNEDAGGTQIVPRLVSTVPASTSEPRYSYRSDGTLLLEFADRDALELPREEADRLFAYLSGIHEGVSAALGVES